jgi:hypothetical protein
VPLWRLRRHRRSQPTNSATGVVQLPDSQILSAFDISFVSAQNRSLPLQESSAAAAYRSERSLSPTRTAMSSPMNLEYVRSPHRCFAAVRRQGRRYSSAIAQLLRPDDISGPNGSLIIEKGANADVWAGDGPISDPPCTTLAPTATSGLVTPSTVKVFDLHTGRLRGEVQTGTGLGTKTPGIRRADELCYNPVSDVILIANDDPADNFITFIGEDSLKVIQRISFDGTDPNALNLLANGIEQCDFNPRDGKFYINLPNTGASTLATPSPASSLEFPGRLPSTSRR